MMKNILMKLKKLRRSYHSVTCGELRDIFRRYGDKQIYLINSDGNEVPGTFYRIHSFLHSYRWELHPLSLDGITAKIESIGSVRRSESSESVKYLSGEAFNQWGGYIDVPVYVCEDSEGADPGIPAFSEYTICGDRVIFRRSRQAYIEYAEVESEWREPKRLEEEKRADRHDQEFDIRLPMVRKSFPCLMADCIVGVSPRS